MATMRYVGVGDVVRIKIAFSEVCMHLKMDGKMVAGTVRNVQLLAGYDHEVVAQLLNDDGTNFSFPILTGEAGIYSEGIESRRYYCYPVDEMPKPVDESAFDKFIKYGEYD